MTDDIPETRDNLHTITEDTPTLERVHQPLPPSVSRATRFLRSQRTEEGGIVGSLHVHDLDDEGISWIALSYCWESNLESEIGAYRDIILNGSPFRVKINLWRALNALVDQREPTCKPQLLEDWSLKYFQRCPRMNQLSYFWVDAICINQNDTEERNHQVLLMKHVYSRAALVIGWLTPFNQLLSEVNRYTANSQGGAGEFRKNARQNLYWTRTWIVQEVMLPQKVLFLIDDSSLLANFGVYKIPRPSDSHECPTIFDELVDTRSLGNFGASDIFFDDFGNSNVFDDVKNTVTVDYLGNRKILDDFGDPSILHNLGHRITSNPSDGAIISKTPIEGVLDGRKVFRRSIKARQSLGYGTLLKRFARCECSDPRDKVFSLTGLVSDTCPIQPDYTSSSLRLFIDVMHVEA